MSVVTNSIESEDLNLAKVFADFYSVPDYQREYVWGEPDAKGQRGDEVEQFLKDIHDAFEEVTKDNAPEYFIGTIVVCTGKNNVFDLIDGQQRTTTAFLTLCAFRDALIEAGAAAPDTLANMIASSSTDWQGETVHRLRLDLQYEDAAGALARYADPEMGKRPQRETRSIRNIENAYDTIREYLRTTFNGDAAGLKRFFGYFVNKVKLIRIQTPSVSRALKIFETINDRGVGLDAMDLLKNLLFMSAKPEQFAKLKDSWRELTQEIYTAGEKPLRFLRYFILATYDADLPLKEENIYDWLVKNDKQTGIAKTPLAFVERLKDAALAIAAFSRGKNTRGEIEHGIVNTRYLGGSSFKQHFILLLAGKHLEPALFARLATATEELMFVWLISRYATKEYERQIVQAAKDLRHVKSTAEFDAFEVRFFHTQKARARDEFAAQFLNLSTDSVRKYRMRYLLAKINQHIEIDAYGYPGRESLSPYLETKNDIEHIASEQPDLEARAEFGEGADDPKSIQLLGNLMLLELSLNRVIQNVAYSKKREKYPTSQFLLARCQAQLLQSGVNDKITRAMKRLHPEEHWDREAIMRRQAWFADVALDVWNLRNVVEPT